MNQSLLKMMKNYVLNMGDQYLRKDLIECLQPEELVEYETAARKELGLDTSAHTFHKNPNFN